MVKKKNHNTKDNITRIPQGHGQYIYVYIYLKTLQLFMEKTRGR